ncbi:putative MFS peptide transporter Ptr2 [Geopyxis carbonaria]|nr:putative MFS peptide transporter Ptr2 [Geopyxis carbonaria]
MDNSQSRSSVECTLPPNETSSMSAVVQRDKEHTPSFKYEVPTAEEQDSLRHVADRIPQGVWMVAFIIAAERFVYFGLTTPLQNYMQNPANSKLLPGALGLGQSTATSLWYFFSFLTFLSPTAGAMVADGWLGRYKTLLLASSIYMIGAIILFATSLPASLQHSAGLGGLITAMLFLGTGVGAFKSCTSAFIGEQYTEKKMRISVLKNGERVILDPKVTIQSIYNIYFWCVNAGSFSVIPATFLEKKVAFWAAFLLPVCVMGIGIILLVLGSKSFVVHKPDGTILSKAFKAVGHGIIGRFNMDAARPDMLAARGKHVPWDDHFIDELKTALVACRVFLPFPILCLCQAQISSNLVSMAASMETHGFPNDLMMLLNPVSILILLPFVDRLLYPFLRRTGLEMHPITRMTTGFCLESLAMAYAAIVQHLVYSAGPCYSSPRACAASGPHNAPNRINVFIQTPIYTTEGFGEIFCTAAGYEYAFTKAPPSMKSLIQALFMATATIGTMFGWALTPLYRDPRLVIMYSTLAAMMAGTMVVGWLGLRKYKKLDDVRSETGPEKTAVA